jgi:hypothetical protein
MLRYINSGMCTAREAVPAGQLKYFILLHFEILRQCVPRLLVQCTKIPLTGRDVLPRMKLLRRTISPMQRGRAPAGREAPLFRGDPA